jgi:hypothetical protein
MVKLFVALLTVVAFAFPASAGADAPTEFPILDVFTDVNPCTGEDMTVTFVGTVLVHEHGSRIVAVAHRTITTSDGAVGHGTDTFVDNGQVLMARLADILTNASEGYRFRARFVFVLDLSTDTVRVDRGGLTCLGPQA